MGHFVHQRTARLLPSRAFALCVELRYRISSIKLPFAFRKLVSHPEVLFRAQRSRGRANGMARLRAVFDSAAGVDFHWNARAALLYLLMDSIHKRFMRVWLPSYCRMECSA